MVLLIHHWVIKTNFHPFIRWPGRTTISSMEWLGCSCILTGYGWHYFFSEDKKGEQFLWNLKAEMVNKSICVAFTEKLPTIKELYQLTDIHSLRMPRISSANVYILDGDMDCFISIDREAWLCLTSDKVWIMAAKEDSVLNEVNCILHSFHGAFSFCFKRGTSQVLNTLSRQLILPNIRKIFTSVMCGFKLLHIHLLDHIVEISSTAHPILL